MRDFTLDDFDRLFGGDIDGMGTVSLDDSYISGDAAVLNAVSGEDGRLVRARRYTPEGHAQTGGGFFIRRAWMPGGAVSPCAILSGGNLTYRRGAVYAGTAGATSGEAFNYIRVRFLPALITGERDSSCALPSAAGHGLRKNALRVCGRKMSALTAYGCAPVHFRSRRGGGY